MKCRIPPLVSLLCLCTVLAGASCSARTPLPAPPPTALPPTLTVPAPSATPTEALATPAPLPLAAWLGEGQVLELHSDFTGAEASYRKVLAADARYAPAHAALSRLYGSLPGREAESLAQAQEAARLAPDKAAGWIALAYACGRALDITGAVEAAERAVRVDGREAVAHAALAHAYLLDHRAGEARAEIERALALDANQADAYAALARWHAGQGDYGRARLALERAQALEPSNVVRRVDLGALLGQLLSYDRATEQYQSALQAVPGYLPAALGLADLAMRRRSYADAAQRIDQATQLNPSAGLPRAYRGRLALLRGDAAAALAGFDEAVKIAPSDLAFQLGLAGARLANGNCQEAMAGYAAVAERQPRLPEAWLGQARAAACAGNRADALRLARQATELDPCLVDALEALGGLLAGQEQWTEARQAYTKAWRCSPWGASVQAGLGQMFLAQRDLQSAADAFRLARRLDPDEPAGEAGVCQAYLASGRPDEALRECEPGGSGQAATFETRRLWSLALLDGGKAEEAARVLQSILAENPREARSHHYLALALMDLGDYEAALRELKIYQSLAQDADPRLETLMAGLEEGWKVRDSGRQAAIFARIAGQEPGRGVEVKIDSSEPPTRTLAVMFPPLPGEDPEQTARRAVAMASAAGLYAPRLSPALEGGLVVVVLDAQGEALYILSATPQATEMLATLREPAGSYEDNLMMYHRSLLRDSEPVTEQTVSTISAEVARLRELKPGAKLAFTRLKQGDYARLLEEQAERTSAGQGNRQALAGNLGLVQSGTDIAELERQNSTEHVLGFYDFDDKTFTLIEGRFAGLLDRQTIAHEYAHVLQDQNFGIGLKLGVGSNADGAMALMAVIEGDAELTQTLYRDQHLPLEYRLLPLVGAEQGTSRIDGTPAFLRERDEFLYEQGLRFVTQVRARGGWPAVNALYRSPPASTAQVMHPELYGRAPLTVTLANAAPRLGKEWRQVEWNTFGELGWLQAVEPAIGRVAAEAAAAGWAGDRYSLLRKGDGESYATAFRTAWADEAQAAEFEALYTSSIDRRTGYARQPEDLLRANPVRLWAKGNEAWAVHRMGAMVTIAQAPSSELALQILSAVE